MSEPIAQIRGVDASKSHDGTADRNPGDISWRALIREDFETHGRNFFSQGFWALWMAGIYLPYTVLVGRRVRLEHFGGMILVADRIGNDVTIRQNTTFGIPSVHSPDARPRIGDRVDIGAGVVIIGDITVGDDVVIGANAVVNKSLPAGVTAGGIPARIVNQRIAAE